MGNARVLAGLLKRMTVFAPTRYPRHFNDRLKLQKTIYILKRGFGIDLGYYFNWHIRGPYSPGLARDAYALLSDYDYNSLPQKRFVDNSIEQGFRMFLHFLEKHKSDTDFLEIAACILYLKAIRMDKSRIFGELQEKNYWLTLENFQEAWSELERWRMI